jgi:hypothetical protein
MHEETINGTAYRIGRLSAKQSFHVLRRLGSVIAAAKPAAMLWLENADKAAALSTPLATTDAAATAEDPAQGATQGASLREFLDQAFDAAGPLATAIGQLTDESSDYVVNTCLSVCQRNTTGSHYAPLVNGRGDLMFADLPLATMMRLVLLVLQENLVDFFSAMSGSISVP